MTAQPRQEIQEAPKDIPKIPLANPTAAQVPQGYRVEVIATDLVYPTSVEFDRSGNTSFFLKDGRGDALGGQYGSIITNLLDIRNSYGRGNFQERFIDPGGSSAIYVFERTGSCVVGLKRVKYGFDAHPDLSGERRPVAAEAPKGA